MLDALALPIDNKCGPNCGVTAVAIAAGVSFSEAWNILQKVSGYGSRWKGRTSVAHRLEALKWLGVKYEAFHLHKRRKLYNWAKDRAEPGVTYMVRTTGHVQIVKDGVLIDQHGRRTITHHDPICRKVVTHITIIEGRP